MPLGILETKNNEEVPGTCLLTDDPNQRALDIYKGIDISLLKHGTGKYSDIILVPQPSYNSNDPLNWPTWKKHLTIFIFIYGTVLCGALGPLVSADLVHLAAEFHVSIQAMSRLLGTAVVATSAIATIVWCMISVTWGKRPVYLASTLIILLGSIVSGEAKTYGVFLGSRILQGIGRAVLEFLVGSSLAEIYFLHERGLPVALWNLASFDGVNIAPPIAGQVLQHLNFRWCFRIFSIATLVLFILQFFLMPETVFIRRRLSPKRPGSKDGLERHSSRDKSSGDSEEHERSIIPHMSYRQSLRVFTGRYARREDALRVIWTPFALLASPMVLWAILVYGTATSWLICIGSAVSQLFSAPPYKFTAAQTGLTFLSPFVFATVAAVIYGPLENYITRRMCKANNGVFEPEYRLLLVIFYAVFGAMGFFGWAISANLGESWVAPVIFFGIMNFGIVIGSSAAISYVVDSHGQSADAALGALLFGGNIFATIVTNFINDWIDARGVLSALSTIGGLVLICSFFTIPMYIYGKRVRLFIHQNLRIDSPAASNTIVG